MGFRITTWNVNGIRNPFGYQPWREQRSFQAMFDILEADIVIMQETKIQRKDLVDDMVLVPGWDVYFSLPKHKKGYSGVVIYTRNATCAPIRAEEGITGVLCPPKSSTSYRDLPEDQQIGGYPRPGQLSGNLDEATLDSEGRCVILEFPAFVLFGVYSPANRDESRDDFRLGFFDALDVRIRNLIAQGKQVILTGDLNVVGSVIDSSPWAEVIRKGEMTLDEWMAMPATVRRIFNQLVFESTVQEPRDEGREEPVLWDICRYFHPDRIGMNTCWDTKKNMRPANFGSRIDYVLCSDGLKDWCTTANIQEGLMGSDHCPVFATFADTVTTANNEQLPLLDVVNPHGMFRGGQRQRAWDQKDLLPLSAKLIPEFDRRRSIRDMFTKRPGPSVSTPSSSAHVSPGPSSEPHSHELTRLSRGQAVAGPKIASSANSGLEASTASTPSPQKPQPVASKRSAEPSGAAARKVQKRSKASTDNSTKAKAAGGQRTLQGFFKPAVATPTPERHSTQTNTQSRDSPAKGPTDPADGSGSLTTEEALPMQPTTPSRAPPPSTSSPDRVFDPIENKESWSKLLGRRVVPRCDHNEPCISLLTKKAGVNCGRSFYICPRPLGPSGEKEKDSEWRCGTFIWSSDWNGPPS